MLKATSVAKCVFVATTFLLGCTNDHRLDDGHADMQQKGLTTVYAADFQSGTAGVPVEAQNLMLAHDITTQQAMAAYPARVPSMEEILNHIF